VAAAVAIYLLLLIPASKPPAPASANRTPFAWNRNAFWSSLEVQFRETRAVGCAGLGERMDAAISRIRRSTEVISAERLDSADPQFRLLETNLFELAPMVAACPIQLPEFARLFTRARAAVKKQSELWGMTSAQERQTVYRLLYGGRAALEEAMLQAPGADVPALMTAQDEPSHTPGTNILGVAVHSGDVLISRGGAATSALIARGNDFPGNFSHVALVHVDERNHAASVIEAHIERGVVISSVADYLTDKKLRLMVLRLRGDLPQLVTDPMLPHKAASLALQEATARHISYDFEMNYRDHRQQFCSEVASAAYERVGVRLWMGISHVSSRGVTSWLAAFGVKYFETQEPSDLEYDPQLRVVAEWRDPETLFQDHADNAVIDAMLEEAEAGRGLDYSWLMLPLVRVAKGYSLFLNSLGRVGPVPEGMSATSALRHKAFSKRHAAIRTRLLELADGFRKQNGYVPPYWELVNLARTAKVEIREP
jgi:Permuted papain-like amidase enzyme, YaeF/YiiX, C92 family